MLGTFDMCVIDPPFITREVWQKYAQAVKILMKIGENGSIVGNLLCSTIDENKGIMKELLNVEPIAFRPSLPTLVY